MPAERSPRNKTLTIDDVERALYEKKLVLPARSDPFELQDVLDRVINADALAALDTLPRGFADLIVVDPPYNLDKNFHGSAFRAIPDDAYEAYVDSWLVPALARAKATASIYVCSDWKSSTAVYRSLSRHAVVRNRITWQREKGRGAARNWKNCSEDIWFATLGDDYYFDVDAVKQRKKVIAPYRDNGQPKDWEESADGKFRLTHPSNFWDDLTVPYWSMRENTDHPTQKPEKLLAKLILASTPPGAIVLDPFAGSGTTAVTAKKLGRRFVTIEQNREYCLWAEKRLARAESETQIQGYRDGAFLGRNDG